MAENEGVVMEGTPLRRARRMLDQRRKNEERLQDHSLVEVIDENCSLQLRIYRLEDEKEKLVAEVNELKETLMKKD